MPPAAFTAAAPILAPCSTWGSVTIVELILVIIPSLIGVPVGVFDPEEPVEAPVAPAEPVVGVLLVFDELPHAAASMVKPTNGATQALRTFNVSPS